MHNAPREIIQLIFSFLNEKNDFMNVALTSKKFNNLVQNPYQAFKTAKLKNANIFYLSIMSNFLLQGLIKSEIFNIACPTDFKCSNKNDLNALEIFTTNFLNDSASQSIKEKARLKLNEADCIVIIARAFNDKMPPIVPVISLLQMFATKHSLTLPSIIFITDKERVDYIETKIKNVIEENNETEINIVKVLGGPFERQQIEKKVNDCKELEERRDINLIEAEKDICSKLENCIYHLLTTKQTKPVSPKIENKKADDSLEDDNTDYRFCALV